MIRRVTLEGSQERRRDGLLAFGVALLPQPHRRRPGIKVAPSQPERALATGAGFEVEADQEQVEVGIVAGGADGVDQLRELVLVQGAAAAAGSTGLGDRGGRVGRDVAGGDGSGEERSEGGDAGLL
jgi:hypothetical protein